ncbi:MAG: S41 family peptidase [Patescibacteria group bacterium]
MENNFSQLNNDNNRPESRTVWSWRRAPLWLVIVLIGLSFGVGVWAGGGAPNLFDQQKIIIKGAEAITTSTAGNVTNTEAQTPDYLKKDVNFNLFWQVWSLVKDKYYVKNIPDTKLFYGSLSGIVASLGDPYSVFMTPQDANQFQEDLKGNFEGIGAEIAVKDNSLIVVAPLSDTPASRAGLRPKDMILKINGTSTAGMNANNAVSLIRGPKGTEVTLTIFRESWSVPKDIKIIRDNITVKSVTWSLKTREIAYIKIRQFNDDTVPMFEQAASEINSKSEVKSVILDLRNNPGGYLESAIEIAGEWIGDKVAVSEKLRDGSETKHHSDSSPKLISYKTIVLVDGGSASASEIVAGALQDWGVATIVGTKTFGKGSVQDLTNLPDGSSVKLTIAKWFTPKGRSIEDNGIEPDIKADLTEADYNKDKDPQLDKAMELLTK